MPTLNDSTARQWIYVTVENAEQIIAIYFTFNWFMIDYDQNLDFFLAIMY